MQYVLVRQVLGTYRYRSPLFSAGWPGRTDSAAGFSWSFFAFSLPVAVQPLIPAHLSSHPNAYDNLDQSARYYIHCLSAGRLSIRNAICSSADISEDLFRVLVSIYRSIRDSSFNVSQLFSFGCVHLLMRYSCCCQLLPCVTVLFE